MHLGSVNVLRQLCCRHCHTAWFAALGDVSHSWLLVIAFECCQRFAGQLVHHFVALHIAMLFNDFGATVTLDEGRSM